MTAATAPARWSICASSLLAALSLAACDSKGSGREESAAGILPGDPYTGWLEVEVRPAAPAAKPWRRYGQGSAQLLETGDGKARLVVFGAIDDDDGDAGFALDGEFTAEGWRSDAGPVSLEIDREGRISGGGTLHPQAFSFSGSATPASFSLEVELELLESGSEQVPAGSVFHFSYGLTRATPRAGEESAQAPDGREKADRKCRRIRYEMRPVANIGDGSMSMLRVPVCLK